MMFEFIAIVTQNVLIERALLKYQVYIRRN